MPVRGLASSVTAYLHDFKQVTGLFLDIGYFSRMKNMV